APVIDTVNNKLLVAVADNTVTPDQASLYVCNLDGSNCAVKDISVGQGQNSGLYPSIAIDPTGHVTTAADGPKGFRCALDGTGCTYHDLSTGHYGTLTSAAVDAVANKLYVAAQDSSTKLALYRCELDGSACAYVDMSGGHPNASGGTPSMVIDPTNQRLLVATIDGSNGYKPALFALSLW
ncbi:MAG TPA: hypothetical protein VLM85_10895, partial [Polyangiaceae bacterium]|nr:hypothetical protein [Polyangiaceae bacterium]